jgi:O-antigen/teichoic acid export membrane protein
VLRISKLSFSSSVRSGSWAITDQALSSATNLALSVVIAHESTKRGFGAFSLAFSAYVIALAIYRAIVTTPLIIRYSAGPPAEQRAQAPACLGLTLVASLVFTFLLVTFGSFASDPLSVYLLAMGCSLPGLLIQDCWRMQMYAAGTPAHAAILDSIWATLQILMYALLLQVHAHGAWFLGAWGLSALLSGLAYSFWLQTWPNISRGLRFFRQHRSLAVNVAGEQVAYIGTTNAIPYLLASIVGLVGVAALRAAQIVLGFLNIPLQGLTPLLIRHATRLHNQRPSALLRHLTSVAAGGSLLIVGCGLTILVLPNSFGVLLVGANWTTAQPLIAATTVMMMAQWIIVAAFIGLRARADARASFWIRVTGSGLMLGAAIAGGLLNGTAGAADGMAIASLGGAVIAWVVLIPRIRRPALGSSPSQPVNIIPDC